MMKLENDIPLILCKLERIFPPSFFDSMEHLPVHLAYEARIAGSVQYRWMYPFERYLRKLKNNVRNKAKVEGSICNAYLVEEASSFCSYYFEDHVNTKLKSVPRNDDGQGYVDEHEETISIFKHPSRAFGKAKTRFMTDEEFGAARTYVLLNCVEVEPFIEAYIEQLKRGQPNISSNTIYGKLENEFADWFNEFVRPINAHDPLNNISNKFIKDLAKGPLRSVDTYLGYYVNGFKFHTIGYGGAKETMNSGVCIKGLKYSTDESDYYGRLVDVVQVEYPGLPIKKTVLFKCEWLDPTSIGMKVHPEYKLVEVNHKCRLNRYEPFVLAIQAAQKIYKWDESIDALVHESFVSQGRKLYTDMVGRFKKYRATKKPPCLSEETWPIWNAYWDRPDVIAKSEQQRKNRMSEKAGPGTGVSRHTGGSRSMTTHHNKLRAELQKEPDFFETFQRTHKKKNGEYVDERSKKTDEEMEARIYAATQEASGSSEAPTINMS